MQAAARPYVLASAAMLATSMVAATPLAVRQLQLPHRKFETQLVDADISGAAAIPFNLFQDLVNIPYNEVEAVNQFGNADLFGGTFFTASATNIFGEDPGDPGRFMSVVDTLFPFQQISGLGQPEIDPAADAAGTAGLSQQIALLIDAEVPASASSDADFSAPLAPVSEITGFSGIDRAIWELAILSGGQQFPLINDWFQVPISDLTSGYDFGTVANPSAGVGADGGVPGDSILGFPGTTPEMGDIGYGVTAAGQTLNEAGNPVNLEPWSNVDFKFDPLEPFQNFFNSLEAPVDPTTYASGFEIPTFQEIGQAFQTFAAGAVVAFDPFVPGSPVCQDGCGIAEPLTQQALVMDINNLLPGNTSIEDWLNLNAQGMANGPTAEEIAYADEFLGGGSQNNFDIGNPLPSDPPIGPLGVDFNPYTPISFPVDPTITQLINLSQESGLQNFAAELAALSGFVPAFGADSAASAAGSTADLSPLFTDLMNPADWSSIFASIF